MNTFHGLTDANWVLKAASQDVARPVLTALYVNEEELVATEIMVVLARSDRRIGK